MEEPYSLDINGLRNTKDKTELVTLECIGNPVGRTAVGNALWEGVTLRKIIEKSDKVQIRTV